MKNKFTYENKYATYENCGFYVQEYQNHNLQIQIISDTEGPITTVTVNPGFALPRNCIAVKDYSENEGMVDWLKSMNLIDEKPLETFYSGYIEIPVYHLTMEGVKIFSK